MMNERIQELAEQAKKYALDEMIKITDRDKALKIYSDCYDAKFAELIVRESANVVWDIAHQYSNDEINDVGYSILEHFGVE